MTTSDGMDGWHSKWRTFYISGWVDGANITNKTDRHGGPALAEQESHPWLGIAPVITCKITIADQIMQLHMRTGPSQSGSWG